MLVLGQCIDEPVIIQRCERSNDNNYRERGFFKHNDNIIFKECNKLEEMGNNMYYADYAIPNGVSVVYGTVRNYFYDLSKENTGVSLNKKIIGGLPAISGHRISVSLIVHCLRDGMSLDEISEDYRIDKHKIIGALDYIVNLLDKPYGEEG